MNTPPKREAELESENVELRAQLEEAEDTLRAISAGEVDALVMGEEVYTLKGAETPYRLLIESMNEGAATLLADGTITYCNRRFADMVATLAEQVIGSCLWQYVVPAQQPVVRSLVATAQQAGARAEMTFRVPGGPELPVLLSLRPIQMDSGTIGVVAADLTERRRAEEALQQAHDTLEQRVADRTQELQQANQSLHTSEERYRLLFQSLQEGFYLAEAILDGSGKCCDAVYLDVNPAFERIMGRPRDQIISKRVKELVPQLNPEWLEVFGKVVRTGEPVTHQTYSVQFQQHFEAFVFRPAPGQFGVLVTDITERKQAERNLFEANQRLQALMQALPVGVSFSDDPTCRRITGNPAVLAQFEATAADNLSASAPDVSAPGRQVRFFRNGQPITDADLPLQRAVAQNRKIPPMELEVVLSSGRRWFTLASGAPICDQQGKVTGGVAVTQDITERKRSEQELQRHVEKMRAANDELKRFNDLMVGRELRMIELKKEINELCARTGEPPRYEVVR